MFSKGLVSGLFGKKKGLFGRRSTKVEISWNLGIDGDEKTDGVMCKVENEDCVANIKVKI